MSGEQVHLPVATGPQVRTVGSRWCHGAPTCVPLTRNAALVAFLMDTSIVTHETRQRQRLLSVAQQTMGHSSEDERSVIARVLDAVRLGEMTTRDAHAVLSSLRAEQQRYVLCDGDDWGPGG